MLPTESQPLWAKTKISSHPALRKPARFDAIIIGGGVTGLSAGLFLKEAGKRVCILERGHLGQSETGHTSAHLTCVTDLRLRDLVRNFDKERAALVWQAGAAALDLIEQIVKHHNINCEFRRHQAW